MNKENELIDITLGDPTPTDSLERKAYVAAVAAFYKNYFEKKLNVMLMNIHNSLEPSDNDREYDMALKGSAYLCRELKLWGESMINEQVANNSEGTEENVDENVELLKEELNKQNNG